MADLFLSKPRWKVPVRTVIPYRPPPSFEYESPYTVVPPYGGADSGRDMELEAEPRNRYPEEYRDFRSPSLASLARIQLLHDMRIRGHGARSYAEKIHYDENDFVCHFINDYLNDRLWKTCSPDRRHSFLRSDSRKDASKRDSPGQAFRKLLKATNAPYAIDLCWDVFFDPRLLDYARAVWNREEKKLFTKEELRHWGTLHDEEIRKERYSCLGSIGQYSPGNLRANFRGQTRCMNQSGWHTCPYVCWGNCCDTYCPVHERREEKRYQKQKMARDVEDARWILQKQPTYTTPQGYVDGAFYDDDEYVFDPRDFDEVEEEAHPYYYNEYEHDYTHTWDALIDNAIGTFRSKTGMVEPAYSSDSEDESEIEENHVSYYLSSGFSSPVLIGTPAYSDGWDEVESYFSGSGFSSLVVVPTGGVAYDYDSDDWSVVL
ncbi:hypothetical protein BJ508DRAFT_363771 [Ascobolus immersus RN42]|uniref:Uncharacterized protein n=1 Tax=Ascobolus immersus RN42 TaxID=1160509 RepID=A0A3N4IA37_ASCIM|nr:hypothetical protein BJ508DRAFT_363771 [Ascobolus immersus RN42]